MFTIFTELPFLEKFCESMWTQSQVTLIHSKFLQIIHLLMTPCSAQKFMPMEFVTYGGVGKTKVIQSQVCIGSCLTLVTPKAVMLQSTANA